ncbi:hypothetical protein [Erythrobacter dokdonensis]|uniref:hypothetical protein n=1 Tax=Erythrobacter dokdonensis TaxID=328225 RepID=UPI000839DCC6|nr:hypothetical protein [Erythrobacter dokdonensis]
MNHALLITTTSSLLLAGCTTLKVHKFADKTSDRQGIAYFLPFSQFDTKLSWTASCDAKTNALKLIPKAEMTPKTGPDPDGLYVIDYASLDAFTKTSDIKVDFYDNGAIKAINASAEDRTGEILSTTLIAVGKVAGATIAKSSEGNDPDKQKDKQPVPVCTPSLISAIKAVQEAKSGKRDDAGRLVIEGVDQKIQNVKTATEQLTAYSAIILRAGGSITDAQKAEHFRRILAVSAAQVELDIATRTLSEAQKKITFTKSLLFPARSSVTQSPAPEMIDIGALAKWVFDDPAVFCRPDEEECKGSGKPTFRDALTQLAKENSLRLKLQANSDFAGRFNTSAEASAEAGIRYRIAVPATLTVCGQEECGKEPIKAFPVQMMNQGTTLYLPFKSKAFTNATLSATFAQNGVMTSAGYAQKRAQGEAVAGAASTLAGEMGSIIDTLRGNEKSELDLLKEETELAKAEKELADARAALIEKALDPNDEAIAQLEAETALREAEVANINAAIARIEANRRLTEAQSSE